VYAVVSGATGPPRGEGVAGDRLRRVRLSGLDLVVGEMARVPRPTAAVLRNYDAAVRRLMTTHGSVLPARYGTCAATHEELAALVADRRDMLRRALRLVRHRVQMTVRVFSDSQAPPSGTVQGRRSESGAAATRGRQFLKSRAAELQIPGTDPLRAAVRKWVRAERSERLGRGRLAGSLYHLVPRTSAPAYRIALQRAARRAAVTIVISGPWPPYAFVGGEW
jgi:hypothetical protein